MHTTDTNGCAGQEIVMNDPENGGLRLRLTNTGTMRRIEISRDISSNLPATIFTIVILSGVTSHFMKSWVPAAVVLVFVCALLLISHLALIANETLTLIPSLGVQIGSQYATGRRLTRFIPIHQVQDVIIHEAVTMHKVVYYLALLLRVQENGKECNSLVPIFLNSSPRLNLLREIHRSVHEMLDLEVEH